MTISGELLSIEDIYKEQLKNNTLIGLAYSDRIQQIKLARISNYDYDVLILGTSRVMQIRDYFFSEECKVFNGGGLIKSLSDLDTVLKTLDDKLPELIILGLDQNFFNPTWKANLSRESKPNNSTSIEIFSNSYKNLLSDLLSGEINLLKLIRSNNVGLTAAIYKDGFRPDGSYQYSRFFIDPESNPDYLFKDTFNRIKKGIGRFEYYVEYDYTAIKELKTFLANCYTQGVSVTCFFPPYAPCVLNRMKGFEKQYSLMFQLKDVLEPVFDEFGYKLIDYSDITFLGVSDKEFIDGFHGSEKAHLRILIDMSRNSELLGNRTNISKLNNLLDASKTY